VSGDRTEQPTPRRLAEARRRGEVARSRELTAAAGLAAGLAAVAAGGPWVCGALAAMVRGALASAAAPEASPVAQAGEALRRAGRPAALLLLAPALAAGAVAVLQTGGALSLEPLRPKLERLGLAAGLRRLFSADALARAGVGIVKAALAGAIVWGWFRDHARALAQLPRLGLHALPRAAPLGSLALRLALAGLAFGLVDWALARRRHLRGLRMTRDEVRRESKEDEGDPQHRAERRRLHRGLLEAEPVSRATVVVVNPTHVAVALRHRRGEDAAPRVLAKGTGLRAARIRSAARRAGVPIVRDVALARALHRLGEVGAEIPVQLYDAAAAVLVHVHGTEGEAR
jgi:type III secretion protein U